MNPEIKAKWVNALRSGEYEQGRRALRTNDKYCCLGVLCDVYVKETGLGHWTEGGAIVIETDYASMMPPLTIRNWAGIEEYTVTFQGEPFELSVLNDRECKSFEVIADLIEEQL